MPRSLLAQRLAAALAPVADAVRDAAAAHPQDPRSRSRVLAVGALAACVLATLVMVAGAVLGGGARDGLASADAATRPPPAAAARAPAAQADLPPAARVVHGDQRGVEIAWVGDTVLGSRHGIPPDEGRPLLAEVRESLRSADLTVGNLEGTFGTGGVPKCAAGTPNCFAFQAPPAHAGTLAWAGFDVVSLANNHAHDFGEEGLRQTTAALDEHGVAHTGAPGRVVYEDRQGVTIAVVGAAPYPWAQDLTDLAAAARLVHHAAERADVVVVTMHAGAEGADRTHTPAGAESHLGEPRGDARAFARTVIDAGADLVVGSGPHVVRGLERYKGRLIAYSTGNFAGFHTFSTHGALGLSAILRVVLDERGRALRGRWESLRIVAPGRPVPDPAGDSARLAAEVSREDFGADAVPPAPGDGTLPLGAERRAPG